MTDDEKKDGDQPDRPVLDLVHRRVPTLYANNAQGVATAEELIIAFGLRTGERHVEPLCRVIMSLYHAKRLAKMLPELIKGYEETFGPIKELPQDRFVKGGTPEGPGKTGASGE